MSGLSENQRVRMRQSLESEADHLSGSRRTEPTDMKTVNRLQKQHDHLFTFLDYDGVDATNNLAERQLRPTVIARVVSRGIRTARVEQRREILSNLAANSTQLKRSGRELIAPAAGLPP